MRHLLKATMAVALGTMLTACINTPTTPSTAGDMQVSREQIYALQPTTFFFDYAPAQDALGDKATCTYNITPAPGATMPTPNAYMSNGNAYCYIMALEPGSYHLEMDINEEYKNGDKHVIPRWIDFTVSDQQPDIRNSFWGSSKAECLQDIHFYAETTPTNVGSVLEFEENDIYYDKYEYDAGTFPYPIIAKRKVTYTLDENNQLKSVRYFILPFDLAITDLVEDMFIHKDYLSYDYYKFSNFTYSAPIAEGVTLTPEEEYARNEFLLGVPTCDDYLGTLVQAVQKDRLTLYIEGTNAKSKVSIQLYHNPKGTMESHYAIFFEPLPVEQ